MAAVLLVLSALLSFTSHTCGQSSCHYSEYLCNGTCVSYSSTICNGIVECRNSTTGMAIDEGFFCMGCTSSTGFVNCFNSGDPSECAPSSAVCDGVSDCSTNTDEMICMSSGTTQMVIPPPSTTTEASTQSSTSPPVQCSFDQYLCGTMCLTYSATFCNGINDCLMDGVPIDELACTDCAVGFVNCQNQTSLECIPASAICNNVSDCSTNLDESSCGFNPTEASTQVNIPSPETTEAATQISTPSSAIQETSGPIGTILETTSPEDTTYKSEPIYQETTDFAKLTTNTEEPTILHESLLIQLRLVDVIDCMEWIETDTTFKRADIIWEVITEVNSHCQCGVEPGIISNAGFQCFQASPNAVTLRARLSGSEQITASDIAEYVEMWTSSGAFISVQAQLLSVDASCPLIVSSFGEEECQLKDSVSSFSDQTAVIIGSTVVVTVTSVLVIGVLIVIAILLKRRSAANTKHQGVSGALGESVPQEYANSHIYDKISVTSETRDYEDMQQTLRHPGPTEEILGIMVIPNSAYGMSVGVSEP